MKILQVTKKFPYPLKDGESLAIINMAKGLEYNGVQVSLLAMNTLKHYYAEAELPEELSFYSKIETVAIDNRFKWINFLLSFWRKESFLAQKYHSKNFENTLLKLIKNNEFDIIQLESIFLAQYIPVLKENFSGLISLRTHNVESLIWERMAGNSRFLYRWVYAKVARKLRSFEQKHLRLPDFIVPISKPDQQVFKSWGIEVKSISIPVGIEWSKYNLMKFHSEQPLQIGFIGALDWLPNVEGLEWFLKNVWKPFNLAKYAQLNIAGRNMPEKIRNKNIPSTTFFGDVPNAIDFMRNNDVLIVPLLSGSGMRVKILEGMALGKVIITSSLGAEGIPITDGQNIIIADTPNLYAQNIIKMSTNFTEASRIGLAAKYLIQSKFSNHKLGEQLIACYHQNLMVPLT